MASTVDLRGLAVRRDESVNGTVSRARSKRRRHLVTRYVLPGLVLLAFATLAAWAARDTLLPSKPVTVVPVLATRAEVQQAGTPLFQAAGWVEPRPTPVLVTALTEGVVEHLLVVEGQQVAAGEPVARLIERDARLALETAQADRELREAELLSARAALTAARTNLSQPIQLETALSEAEAALAKVGTELANVPFQLRTAESRERLARATLDERKASKVFSPLAIQQSQSELDTATSAVEELRVRRVSLERENKALTQRRDSLKKRLELKTDETRNVAETEAKVKAEEARVQLAQKTIEAAQLRVERMTIRAPTAGRVLALVARPGMRVSGLAPGSLYDSSTVVTLYDPQALQVRADVRLEDVPRVQPGQPVRIETAAVRGDPLTGVVLFATSQADVQKNTLQVKVAIELPPAVIKPDMLVQLTFLALPNPGAKAGPTEQLRLMIPRQLVDSAAEGTRVWVADQAAGRARHRSVKLGQAGNSELVEVVEGLTNADKLIVGGRDGLQDGDRIKVTGEDATLGTSSPSAPKTTKPAVNSTSPPDSKATR